MSIQLTKIIADFDTQLAAPVSAGDTTATIVSVTDDDGNTIPNGTYGFTIDAGNSSKEYIICTLTSTALTAIYTATRQGVTTSGFARAHRRGAKVTITDWSAIKGIQNVLEVGYASATTPTTDYMLATKKYVDDASFAGATNASTTTPGVVELPVQSEVDAGTASGGAGPLVVTPDTLRARNFNDYAVDSVGSDDYAITITPAITAYTAGQRFTFKAGTANTGACTLNVSGLGAKTIKKDVSSDLDTGDILANQIIEVEYDGTNMQMVSANSTFASTTQRGVVEEATQSEVDAGTATGATGARLFVNPSTQRTPFFQQDVRMIEYTQTIYKGASNQDGSVFVTLTSGSTSRELTRYAKDTKTGYYYMTNETGITPTVNTSSVVIVGSYIYIFYDGGNNTVCYRYLLADLSGETLMTMPNYDTSGTNYIQLSWTDGTNIYLTNDKVSTTYYKLSISGTTLTQIATGTTMGAAGSTYWFTWFDGTTMYVNASNTGNEPSFFKFNDITLTGWTQIYVDRIPNISASSLPSTGIILPIDAERLYIGKPENISSASAVIGQTIKLYPVTKI